MTKAHSRRLSAVMGVALLATLLGVYADALRHPFIFDDIEAIQNNEHVLKPRGICNVWTDNYWRFKPRICIAR